MRNDEWLKKRLDQIWDNFFPEVKRKNNVIIRFKGKSINQFGYIKKVKKDTLIVINSLFRDERVPSFIVYNTIAHELVHYMHGFQSPLEKKYKHPHRGGIVEKELRKKGFAELIEKEKEWTKDRWEKVFKEIKRQAIGFN